MAFMHKTRYIHLDTKKTLHNQKHVTVIAHLILLHCLEILDVNKLDVDCVIL